LTYESLLDETEKNDIYVIENANFISHADGLINGDVIGLNRKIRSQVKRSCILAEELGHYHTTVGNILDQTNTGNRKQEYRARLWAYNKMIGLSGIIAAYKANVHNRYEMAEYLDVTEEFLDEALSCYREKYGICTKFDNYIIYFEPTIAVLEIF